ncbi:MAG: hypothetical protein GAK32_00265 [Pseudomonas fluorescens]|nr:MAG: hypothetical protein GAK32_00265 [Pseudomonas fluorescens]
MIKSLALVAAFGLVAGCSSAPAPEPGPDPAGPAHKRCYQADWQAETMPVISKRIGPERLEKYDAPSEGPEQGCP